MTTREEVWVSELPDPISHYTHGVKFGDLVFVSGCTGTGASHEVIGVDDVAAQTRQALTNMSKILAAAGATFADVCKVTVYLTDINDREKINPIRQEFFGESRPASTLIEISKLAFPGAKVEIEAIACLSS
jgi:2-iminobutanoate/2-iminopropanoate deaminase